MQNEIAHDVFFNKVLDLQYGEDGSKDPVRCFWTGEVLETRSDCRLVCVRPNAPRGNPEDYVIVSKRVADKLEEEARTQSGKSIPRASLGDWSLRLILEKPDFQTKEDFYSLYPTIVTRNYFEEDGVDKIMEGLKSFSAILSEKETGEHTEIVSKSDIERNERNESSTTTEESVDIPGNYFGNLSGVDDKIFARDIEQYTPSSFHPLTLESK